MSTEANSQGQSSDAVAGLAQRLDHQLRSKLSRLTLGMSPTHVAGAGLDWAMNLAMSPGKQLKLAESGIRKTMALGKYAFSAAIGGDAEPVAANAEIPAIKDDQAFSRFFPCQHGSKKWSLLAEAPMKCDRLPYGRG